MPFDKFVDMETVSEERRKAIHGSLGTMSLVDLHQLVKELSDFEGDPSQENLVSAIEAHPETSFYRAVTQEATQRAHNTAQSIEATGEHYGSPSGAEKHHFAKRRNKGVNN
jgi:Fe-S-cluster formation regulator IscX/YfhJ